MTSLAFGKGAYRRLAAGLPELRLVNMHVEAAATSQDGVVLLSRPALVRDETRGTGPIRALYHEPGSLGGALFALSGDTLMGPAALGSVSGEGPAKMAASALELLVTSGAGLMRTNGGALAAVAFPDGASVRSVAYLGGYFVALRDGTHRFYWSALRDASSWDALDYASAESSPDPLLDVVVTGDVMWLLGASTIEPWQLTGDTALPFSRIEGRNYQRGVRDTGCAVQLDNGLMWIGDDNRIYRNADAPVGLSDPGIEERVAASVSASLFAYEYAGHKLLCVRLDAETLAFDVATGEWSELASYGLNNYDVQCATQFNGVPRLGSTSSGAIYRYDAARYDDDGRALSKLFTAFAPVADGNFTLDVLHLDADMGSTPSQQGQGADPSCEVRYSRDAGRTWSAWRQTALGRQGQYRARAVWRRFGSFDAPGAMFEIRTSDPVRFRVSAVRANEDQGGRSR